LRGDFPKAWACLGVFCKEEEKKDASGNNKVVGLKCPCSRRGGVENKGNKDHRTIEWFVLEGTLKII